MSPETHVQKAWSLPCGTIESGETLMRWGLVEGN
jgi:hypothetical protein